MDLATRKYNFIQELIHIDKESILDALEKILKQKREETQKLKKSGLQIPTGVREQEHH